MIIKLAIDWQVMASGWIEVVDGDGRLIGRSLINGRQGWSVRLFAPAERAEVRLRAELGGLVASAAIERRVAIGQVIAVRPI
ncbi:MAG: hypothetical protein VW338_16550 [Rhodospirillaceae bacterium]